MLSRLRIVHLIGSWLQRARPARRRFRLHLGGAVIAGALLQLQMITQPHVRHLVVEKMDERADDDGSGDDPNDPLIHLHRQAERIRKGEQVDPITALLPHQVHELSTASMSLSLQLQRSEDLGILAP